MKSKVSYEKSMRDKAIAANHGLFTIDIMNASKRPGRFGSRMTMQGPVDGKKYKAITAFILKIAKWPQVK